MLEQLKEELYTLHLELVRYNLVVWTGGNVSATTLEAHGRAGSAILVSNADAEIRISRAITAKSKSRYS